MTNSLISFIEKSYMDVIHIAEDERKPKSKENLVEFSMFISKANLDNNGKMLWAASGSDTKKDSFNENMSRQLFETFLSHINQGVNLPIYLSLAHYPRLSGKGEAGVATDVFIDGDILKAKGYFSNTPLGTKIYNSIRQDRRNNIAQDKRVRISIGFYDQMHSHSNGVIWEYKPGVVASCSECEKNPKGGKTYLSGVLEHFAVTRVPVNTRTDIVAKSESETMTTRYEDALSIVGDASIVDPIERAVQEERVEKSETNQTLITKADNPNPVGNAMDLQVPNLANVKPNNPTLSTYQVLSGLPKETLLQLFGKMESDGTLSTDAVSELVNYIMNNLTDRSNVEKADTGQWPTPLDSGMPGAKVSANKPEKKKKDIITGENAETAKLNNIAGHVEFSEAEKTKETDMENKSKNSKDTDKDPEDKNEGPETEPENDAEDKKEKKVKKSDVTDGGRSTNDTQPDTVKLIGAVEALVNAIGQLIARPASVATTGEKVENAKEPDGTSDLPLPTSAVDFTTSNNQIGPGTPISGGAPNGSFDEASPIKGVVSDFSEAMKNAVSKSGNDRKVAFQEILNQTAGKMKELDAALDSQNQTVKSEGQIQQLNVEEVVNRIIDEKLIPIQAGQAEIKSLIQGLTLGKSNTVSTQKQLEVPQMKSIVNATGVPQVQKSQMMSIADIAHKTTIGTLK